jgi:sulfur carrier protein
MIVIELNGAPHTVAPASTVASLVQGLGLGQQALALAVNRSVVPRAQWHERTLQPSDQVDLVRAIGGG